MGFQSRVVQSYEKESRKKLSSESLVINGKEIINSDKKITKLFGTESLNKMYDGSISFIRYIARNSILDETDPNVKIFNSFYKFVNGMLSFHHLDGNEYQGLDNKSESLYPIILENNKLKDFEEFLSRANLKFNLEERLRDNQKIIVATYESGKEVEFFKVASKGIRALTLFYTWFLKFNEVSLVLMDEFDRFYHNDLSKFVIEEVVKTPVQSIFSSHNTNDMSNEILRPNNYFIIENAKITALDKVTSKELRKAHNIEKMYKAGAFNHEQCGAIHDIIQ